MDKYKAEEIVDKKIWEKFVLSKDPKTFLQSWNWGEVHKILQHKIFRIGYLKNNKLVGVSLLIKETARRGQHLLVPGGPILDWKDQSLIDFCLKKIIDLAKKEKVWFIRIRPDILSSVDNKKIFKKKGFIDAPMHLHAENTLIIDIAKSDAEILSGMRKTTRYLVKKSLSLGFSLEKSIASKKSEILYKLQKETTDRLGFIGFPLKIFQAQLTTFASDNQALIFIVKKGKLDLAAAIVIFYGNSAYYHHSGSSNTFRNLPFSYFLQWKIIEEAKIRGLKIYNLWGIAPNDNPKHRFFGVSQFKKGFGGESLDLLHALDLPVSWLYLFTYIFETGRRVLRRL